jgi:pantetheine-phosphate adenylyltransferase
VTVALYPGTFDPPTLGHLDIVERGARLFDRVVIAAGARIDKKTLLTPEQRVDLMRQTVAHLGNCEVLPFEGLVVNFAREQGADVLLRGIRNPTDYEYENQMALTNRRLAPGLETVFLPASPDHTFLSSTLIKEVLAAGGDIEEFVPKVVAEALREAWQR